MKTEAFFYALPLKKMDRQISMTQMMTIRHIYETQIPLG